MWNIKSIQYTTTRRKYSKLTAEVAPKWLDRRLSSPISLLLCALQFSSENMYYLKTKNQNPKMPQTPILQCGMFLVYLGLPHPAGYRAIFFSDNCYFNPSCWGQSSVSKKRHMVAHRKTSWSIQWMNEWMSEWKHRGRKGLKERDPLWGKPFHSSLLE